MENQANQKKSLDRAMEEAVCFVLRGCASARELEAKVSNMGDAVQPEMLSKSCDEIISIFRAAKERLSRIQQREVGLEEWLRSACTQAMEMAQMQAQKDKAGFHLGFLQSEHDPAKLIATASSSSSLKPRKRKEEMERTVRVAAPRIGNTELPPDDGYTWRKYGQKEILGSRFPRGYFRCTHQKLYNCPAKKHVQRLDDDPFTFEVTYRDYHICHMSSTAPSVLPVAQITGAAQFPTVNSVSLRNWVSSGSGGSKEADQFPVLDMADAMFNSATCSSNSMDSIFPAHQKWEKDDDNNNN